MNKNTRSCSLFKPTRSGNARSETTAPTKRKVRGEKARRAPRHRNPVNAKSITLRENRADTQLSATIKSQRYGANNRMYPEPESVSLVDVELGREAFVAIPRSRRLLPGRLGDTGTRNACSHGRFFTGLLASDQFGRIARLRKIRQVAECFGAFNDFYHFRFGKRLLVHPWIPLFVGKRRELYWFVQSMSPSR